MNENRFRDVETGEEYSARKLINLAKRYGYDGIDGFIFTTSGSARHIKEAVGKVFEEVS